MTDQGLIFDIQKFSIHDGPGIRTVVFLKGCPLRCYWCSNPESISGKIETMWDNDREKPTKVGEYKTVSEILKEVVKDKVFYEESGGGVTLSGGEILYQSDFTIKLLKALKEENIHAAAETSAYAETEIFAEVISYLDLVYIDFKHYNLNKHKKATGKGNDLIKKNIKYAINNHDNVIIRIPIIPDYNDSVKDALNFAEAFNKIGVKEVELLPFHQFGSNKYENLDRDYKMKNVPQLHTDDLVEYQEIMLAHNIRCNVR
jgi:pyruvate formate lyase activating enzyme